MQAVPITYFSDVLCVWAYIAQLRVNAVKAKFGDKVRFEKRSIERSCVAPSRESTPSASARSMR